MADLNPFESFGSEHARKVHTRRVAAIKQQKEQDDQLIQFGLYRKANRVELTKLLNDPKIGDKVLALVKFLKTLGLDSAPTLVDYVNKSTWLLRADEEVRYRVLSIIGDAITRLRVQHGLAPFDDSLMDEPPTAFQIIRKQLTGV